jgi:hypothetical protein
MIAVATRAGYMLRNWLRFSQECCQLRWLHGCDLTLIVRPRISLSSPRSLSIPQHDAHDHMAPSRTHTRKYAHTRTHLRTCTCTHVGCFYYSHHADHDVDQHAQRHTAYQGIPPVRNLFEPWRLPSVQMSPWVFLWLRRGQLVAIRLFSETGRSCLSRLFFSLVCMIKNDNTSKGERGPLLSKPNYRHTLKHYAESYQTSDRTVRRWVTIGRKANKEKSLQRDNPAHLPPLDRPEKMMDWWTEHLKTDLVPERLCELANPVSPNGNGEEGGLDVDSLDGADLWAALTDSRRHRDAMSRRLKDAQRANNIAAITRCSAAYEKLSAAAMRCEEVVLKRDEFSKKFVPLSGVQQEIGQFLYSLKQFRSTMPKRILQHLSVLALSPDVTERLAKAIEIEREAEDTYLRDLNLEKVTPEEVERLGIEVVKQTEEITKL